MENEGQDNDSNLGIQNLKKKKKNCLKGKLDYLSISHCIKA